MTTAAHARRRLAFPLLFVVLWSTGFISAKYGLPYAPPLTFLLYPVCARRGADGRRRGGLARDVAAFPAGKSRTSSSPDGLSTASTWAACS
jgi:hypothetical protein